MSDVKVGDRYEWVGYGDGPNWFKSRAYTVVGPGDAGAWLMEGPGQEPRAACSLSSAECWKPLPLPRAEPKPKVGTWWRDASDGNIAHVESVSNVRVNYRCHYGGFEAHTGNHVAAPASFGGRYQPIPAPPWAEKAKEVAPVAFDPPGVHACRGCREKGEWPLRIVCAGAFERECDPCYLIREKTIAAGARMVGIESYVVPYGSVRRPAPYEPSYEQGALSPGWNRRVPR